MKPTVAAKTHKQAEHFLSCMRQHFEQDWDQLVGIVPNDDGRDREVTGQQMMSYLTALNGSPDILVRFMRQQEKALDAAAYLVAALADPKHGAGSSEVRDTLEDLTEEINIMRLLTPYQQKDGSLAV